MAKSAGPVSVSGPPLPTPVDGTIQALRLLGLPVLDAGSMMMQWDRAWAEMSANGRVEESDKDRVWASWEKAYRHTHATKSAGSAASEVESQGLAPTEAMTAPWVPGEEEIGGIGGDAASATGAVEAGADSRSAGGGEVIGFGAAGAAAGLSAETLPPPPAPHPAGRPAAALRAAALQEPVVLAGARLGGRGGSQCIVVLVGQGAPSLLQPLRRGSISCLTWVEGAVAGCHPGQAGLRCTSRRTLAPRGRRGCRKGSP